MIEAIVRVLRTVAVGVGALAITACAARPRMCAQPAECGPPLACVAGRCQPSTGVPEIQSTTVRRIVLEPTDIAYVRRGDGARDARLPTLVTLGRSGDGDALLLMRFALPLGAKAKVVEAYLLLERSELVDSDPTPVSLHLARVVEPWEPRSVSWALQPRTEGARTPATVVPPAGRGMVRLDARELVNDWRAHDPRDQGIAVIADNATITGITFATTGAGNAPAALAVSPAAGLPASALDSSGARETARAAGPRLEVYLK